jgi:chromosome segregation ATPase
MSFVQGEGVYQQSLKGVKELLHADHVRKLEARDAELSKRCEQLGAMAELHRVASRKHEVVNSGLKKELQAVTALHMQVEDSHQQAQRDIKALQASLDHKGKELHSKSKELHSKSDELLCKSKELHAKSEELKGLHGDMHGLRKSHEQLQRKHRNTSGRLRALQQKLPALRESLDVAMLAVERGSEDSVRQCLSHLCNVVEGVHGELLLAE